MISKITAILAAALVLGSAGAASAQTHRHAGWQAPYANSYNQDTRNLRYGHASECFPCRNRSAVANISSTPAMLPARSFPSLSLGGSSCGKRSTARTVIPVEK
jgi:hypothetical protein